MEQLPPDVKLLAVSKFQPVEALMEAYRCGQRRFGENRAQEFAEKAKALPSDIEWHFIGHLQTNKLKLVLPYAYMVQSVDSVRLVEAIEAWAARRDRTVRILLEEHLGAEETKQGFTEAELREVLAHAEQYGHLRFCGLMGMATRTGDEAVIRRDFGRIAGLRQEILTEMPQLKDFTELSIGMSGDWRLALEYGATCVRIGTAVFGPRPGPEK